MTTIEQIKQQLCNKGWILLRGEDYNLSKFSNLIGTLCERLTYDPAREYVSKQSQKVDAGTQAMGLHIENGTTPMPPDIISFFSELAVKEGAQTTICDGHQVWQALSNELKEKFSLPVTISRRLKKEIWQSYIANAFGMEDPNQVTKEDLDRFAATIPGQSFTILEDDSVHYHLEMPMIRSDNISRVPAFANAMLGPSYNYEKPIYTFSGGIAINDDIKEELTELCEKYTQEIQWQNNDVLVIDNKRIMHGRREITVPLEERKLYICMGLGVKV